MRTPPPSDALLEDLRARPDGAGVFLDFDGSLSEIVDRPDLAEPAAGAADVLAALRSRFREVAIISGRPANELASRLGVDGLTYEGLYGMEEAATDLTVSVLPAVERAAASVPEARLEDKRVSVAVHYRGARDPAAARRTLVTALEPVASDAGLVLIEGKMVVELLPADRPLKGDAVERLARSRELQAVLYAGDDVADLDAFSALDRLDRRGVHGVRVAVRGPETPQELLRAADLEVDGPAGLVALLRTLA